MMNALKHVEYLVESGFTQQQSKGSVYTTVEIMNENLASKEDLKNVVHNMNTEFLVVRSEFSKGFSDVRLEMKEMENRITYKLSGIVVIALGLFKGLEEFF